MTDALTVADPDATYAAVAGRLRDGPPSPTVVALPDGSIDFRCRVEVGAGGEPPSREQLGREIAAGDHKSLRIVPGRAEPGGQAVNLAEGADALGAEVRLFGHLEDPEMRTFPFPAHSMGEPATVRILDFEDGALMLAEESADILSWRFADLVEAVDGAGLRYDRVLSPDALACCNWVSFPHMPSALRKLAGAARDTEVDGVFVIDPGDVVGSDRSALRDLLAVLGELESAGYDAILNANRRELREFDDALAGGGIEVGPPGEFVADTVPDSATDSDSDRANGAPGDPSSDTAGGADVGHHDRDPTSRHVDASRLRRIRAAADVTGVVMHARTRATMATDGGVVSVPNLAIGEPERWTGGGDRFGAGLATGLGAGWDAAEALALGNAAASYYVTHAEVGDAEALAEFVTDPEYRP